MNTLFTGQKRVELEVVDSTNSYAQRLLQQGGWPEGTLVLAHEQLEGRGQRGTTWQSKAGLNITASFIFYPVFLSAEKQFFLSKTVALGVAGLLDELLPGVQVKIKWPNDIYCGNKKIAGLLLENSLRQHSIASSVAGIGLNVNQETFPGAGQAISMKQLSGANHDLQAVLEKLCEILEARYLQLRAGKYDLLDRDYHEKLYRLGEWCDYSAGGTTIKGKILSVKENGKLLLETGSGEQREFDLKEIAFI